MKFKLRNKCVCRPTRTSNLLGSFIAQTWHLCVHFMHFVISQSLRFTSLVQLPALGHQDIPRCIPREVFVRWSVSTDQPRPVYDKGCQGVQSSAVAPVRTRPPASTKFYKTWCWSFDTGYGNVTTALLHFKPSVYERDHVTYIANSDNRKPEAGHWTRPRASSICLPSSLSVSVKTHINIINQDSRSPGRTVPTTTLSQHRTRTDVNGLK